MKIHKKTIRFFALGGITAVIGLVLVSFCGGMSGVGGRTAAGIDKVKVEGGYISGLVNSTGAIHVFKGIPFAAPPVGPLRWKAPQPVVPWNGVRACEQFGASPMQAKPAPFKMWTEEFMIPTAPIGEDCLYLNVWTGAKTAREKRPVLLWIYGGAFTSGGGNVPIYDGEAMARKGVIFVSVNYRLGIFGFFSHPGLTRESDHQASGNYGLMDQIAALEWVQKNIAAFGGDPGNVTIGGQSAGSMSVNCLVASPLAKGLFQKAIAESGGMFTRGNASLASSEAQGQKLGESLNAGSIAALRGMSAEDLLKKTPGFGGPIIDGYVLPEQIADIFGKGEENKVSLLTGWNEDEGILFGPVETARNYRREVGQLFGGDSLTLLRYYPAGDDSEAAASQLKLSRDLLFGRQNYSWATISSGQGQRAYVYRFTCKPPTASGAPKYGAYHTAEVPYAYNNLKFVRRPWRPVDYNLADVMSSYWANFVKAGDPNGTGLPVWSPYTTDGQNIMVFGDQATAGILQDKEMLDFLVKRMMKN